MGDGTLHFNTLSALRRYHHIRRRRHGRRRSHHSWLEWQIGSNMTRRLQYSLIRSLLHPSIDFAVGCAAIQSYLQNRRPSLKRPETRAAQQIQHHPVQKQ
ncbi:hypothetical protein GCM10025770_11740 [Viridibacterium curvum]|uniref:Uncharacterized protein n=1 Tax=Viridibacterium curvum TaxID=1101404 RepID=A0ABP9QH42_9RHOO